MAQGGAAPVYRLVAGEAPRLTAPAARPHPAGRRRPPGPARCSCSPARAPARRRRSSRPSPPASTPGVDPEQILVLTFSRKAAAELRTRITGRVARTIREPLARTFHSYAYGVLRRAALLRGDAPPRLLTSAEQDAVVAELLRGDAEEEGAVRWPAALAPALATAGSAPSCATC